MERVEFGLMLPGAYEFDDENINPTWRAHVNTDKGIKIAYVKEVNPRSLYIECVCAVVGRFLGLPIPKPLIVKITHDAFDWVPKDQPILAFGSEDAGYPSFRRYARTEEARSKLKNFSKTIDVAVFDEWIGNWDRNVGNILYDGKNKFCFIDHENALHAELEASQAASDNQLARSFFVAMVSEFEKYKKNKMVQRDIIPNYHGIPYALIADKTLGPYYLDEAQVIDIIKFLESRLNYLGVLFEKRLQIKQRSLSL